MRTAKSVTAQSRAAIGATIASEAAPAALRTATVLADTKAMVLALDPEDVTAMESENADLANRTNHLIALRLAERLDYTSRRVRNLHS